MNSYTSLLSQKNTTLSVNIAFRQHNSEARGLTTSASKNLRLHDSAGLRPPISRDKHGQTTLRSLFWENSGRFFCFLDSLCEPFWAILCLTGIGEVPLAVRASHNSPSHFFEPNDLSATMELSTTILAATVRRNTWTDRPIYGRGTNLEAEQCC